MGGAVRKVILVYNPRSSQAATVKKAVWEKLRKQTGVVVGKYAVEQIGLAENARALAGLLADGDLVITAGGDGTAAIGLNGVMQSGKAVTLGVLPYGNFNDLARTLRTRRVEEILTGEREGKVRNFYPLEVSVNGRFWRWVGAYLTVGMLAESTQLFDEPKIRARLQKRKLGRGIYSLRVLANWYFRNRRRQFLEAGATDYLVVNGRSMARWLRGGRDFLDERQFRAGVVNLRGIWSMTKFMLKSGLWQVPGQLIEEETRWEFAQPRSVMLQAEGEYQRIDEVREITVRKRGRGVRAVML